MDLRAPLAASAEAGAPAAAPAPPAPDWGGPEVAPAPATGAWDWRGELEALRARLARGRAEEAGAIRRGAEDSHRQLLRQLEDAERGMVRGREEESAALYRFLSGWHTAIEARLDRQAAQVSSLDQRVAEEAACAQQAEAARHAEAAEALTSIKERLQSLDSELRTWTRAAIEEAVAAAQTSMHEAAHSMAQQVASEHSASLRDELASQERRLSSELRTAVEAAEALGARLGVAEAGAGSCARELEALQPLVGHLAGRLALAEEEASSRSAAADEALARESRGAEARAAALQAELGALARRGELQAERAAEHAARLAGQLQGLRGAGELAEAAEAHAVASEARLAGAEAAAGARADERAAACGAEAAACGEAAAEAARASAARLEAALRASERELESRLEAQLQAEVRRAGELAAAGLSELGTELALEQRRLEAAVSESAEESRLGRADCSRLSAELEGLRAQGLAHQWCIRRCLQRLRYLSLDSCAGLWLDSESFSLGSLGPLILRFYPRGLLEGDGQCALELRLKSEASAARFVLNSAPLSVDLAIGDLSRRVVQGCTSPAESDAVWFAESLGDLKKHTSGSDTADLLLRVELPWLPASAHVSRSEAPGSVEPAVGMADEWGASSPNAPTEEATPLTPAAEVVRPQADADLDVTTAPTGPPHDALDSPLRLQREVLDHDSRGVKRSPLPRPAASTDHRGAGAGPAGSPSGVFAIRSTWGRPSPFGSAGGGLFRPGGGAGPGGAGFAPEARPPAGAGAAAPPRNPFEAPPPATTNPFDARGPFGEEAEAGRGAAPAAPGPGPAA